MINIFIWNLNPNKIQTKNGKRVTVKEIPNLKEAAVAAEITKTKMVKEIEVRVVETVTAATEEEAGEVMMTAKEKNGISAVSKMALLMNLMALHINCLLEDCHKTSPVTI